MITVFVEKEEIKSSSFIEITQKNDINHLKNVFRVEIGESIRVVDGENEYFTIVESIENRKIVVKIESQKKPKDEEITVDACISVLKNDKMDLVVQKLTEIGVRKIIPFAARRGVVKLSEKKEKWEVIAKEALKQCGGIKKVEFDEIKAAEKLNYSEYDLIVVPYECEEENSIFKVFEKKEIKKILYIIGPEGGFEAEEVEKFKREGAVVVSLGKRILRAETAAIVTGGILINGFR